MSSYEVSYLNRIITLETQRAADLALTNANTSKTVKLREADGDISESIFGTYQLLNADVGASAAIADSKLDVTVPHLIYLTHDGASDYATASNTYVLCSYSHIVADFTKLAAAGYDQVRAIGQAIGGSFSSYTIKLSVNDDAVTGETGSISASAKWATAMIDISGISGPQYLALYHKAASGTGGHFGSCYEFSTA